MSDKHKVLDFAAFPTTGMVYPNGNIEYPEPGMSFRQWAAAKAMAAILACPTTSPELTMRQVAETAVAAADALILELAK